MEVEDLNNGDKVASQTIEEDFVTVKEGKAEILFPKSNNVFYNPPQEFNRDITIAAIGEFAKEKLSKQGIEAVNFSREEEKTKVIISEDDGNKESLKRVYAGEKCSEGISILEALSATGLRSTRFAKELSGVNKIVANDLSQKAYESIQRNIKLNKIEDIVSPNLGDATMLMYESRHKSKQFDVVDIDPYGTASMFIDSAVQAVSDGGLLCVTCTDMAVLAGNHPEACWAKYSCIPFKTKACHEQALRILLYQLSVTAAKYSRHIVPLISVSIDYYVRVFVRVHKQQRLANLSATNQMYLWRCGSCSSFFPQPLANAITKGKSESLTQPFAPLLNRKCPDCDNNIKIGGPFWAGPLHDMDFVKRVLDSVKNSSEDRYGSSERIIGILTMIEEELNDVPFYYVSDELSSVLRCSAPPNVLIRSALMNGGYRVSAFHGKERSVKTDAPSSFVWDIMRKWVDLSNNPALQKRLLKLDVASAAKKIFAKDLVHGDKVDLTIRKDCQPVSAKKGITRFPQLPPNWGPKAKAVVSSDGKFKLTSSEKSRKFQGKRKSKNKQQQPAFKKSKEEEKSIAQ